MVMALNVGRRVADDAIIILDFFKKAFDFPIVRLSGQRRRTT
jgi:hypothetical protein